MTSRIILWVIGLLLLAGAVQAQSSGRVTALNINTTSDGAFLVKGNTLYLRDYILSYTAEYYPGVLSFIDRTRNVRAQININSLDRYTILVFDNGVRMNLYADRANTEVQYDIGTDTYPEGPEDRLFRQLLAGGNRQVSELRIPAE